MVVKAETPISREKLGNKKKKSKKAKDETKSPKLKNSNVITYDESAQQPTVDQTLLCIDALKKVHKSKEKNKSQGSLFDDVKGYYFKLQELNFPRMIGNSFS